MAQTDDEKPQVEDEAQDAPEVVAHGVDDDATLGEMDCKIFVEL
ncbi:hypothetical protein EDD99_1771 [Streptomyces sp. 846.5]|nr:hypothetical protein [Streptomyces sp. 846.5]TDU03349.1 hypothetical protein EDD99_1771 [Streptomyces sp. 846.5]